jgi:flagellar biosynthesis protein FlhB
VSGGEDKTEKPTAKKLTEARKQGQFGRTPDLGAWLGLGAGVMTVPMMLGTARTRLAPLLDSLDDVAAHPEPARMLEALHAGGAAIVPLLAPIAVVTVVVAIGSSAAQGGLRFATKAAKPSFARLNLVKGLKNMVSLSQVWQMLKSLLKTAVIGLVLWSAIRTAMPAMLSGDVLPLSSVIGAVRGGTASMVRTAVAAGLVLAVADYVVAQRKVRKQLRMTKQEVKDEHKSSEGNPEIKAAIRSRQRQMSRNRMMAAIATADVVLVNPTHVAVALRYEAERGAPRVVAKGSGHVAARIREKATEHGVPMVADIPLARALHSACELDQEVPAHLYVAVAQVLAFVMALRKRGSAAGIHRSPTAA